MISKPCCLNCASVADSVRWNCASQVAMCWFRMVSTLLTFWVTPSTSCFMTSFTVATCWVWISSMCEDHNARSAWKSATFIIGSARFSMTWTGTTAGTSMRPAMAGGAAMRKEGSTICFFTVEASASDFDVCTGTAWTASSVMPARGCPHIRQNTESCQ